MKSTPDNSTTRSHLTAKARFQNAVQNRAPVAFIVDDTLVDKIGQETVLTLFCDGRYDESEFQIDIVLESPIYRRQERGQKELGRLCESVGLRTIEDSPELHGKEAVLRRADDGELFFTPHNLIFTAS